MKISRRSITGLDPGVYYDSELKGFGLRIGAGGTGTGRVRGEAGERQVTKKQPEVAAVANGGGPIGGCMLLTRLA